MSFHTTLQMITKQGSKPILVKVDPGADVNTVPLSKYRKLFSTHFTKASHLKQKIVHPTRHTWRAHDETPQQFLGFFIADIHHKTTSDVLPVRFYVFKDTTSPKILLSYAASEKLGIVKFQIPNKTPTAVDAITTKKRVTFRTPIHTCRPVKKNTRQPQPLKSAIKKHTLQDHGADSSLKQLLQDSGTQSSKKQPFQDHPSTEDVKDIIAIEKAFPESFDHVGNLPGIYTMHLDPSIPPVQHARRKVPIECKEQIEKALQKMEDLQIITPVTEPIEWVSSITYPRKSDSTIHICLDPKDLNIVIISKHYKAPTLAEISHKLSGATIFSKLDAKDGFWSIHLDTTSSYLTTFNTHKGRYIFLCMPFGLKMSQDVFQMRMDHITDRLPGVIAIHDDICVYGKTHEQHNRHLLQLLKTAKAKSLVFNSRNIHISQKQITFFGMIFSGQGMKPDPIKI